MLVPVSDSSTSPVALVSILHILFGDPPKEWCSSKYFEF